VYYRKKVKGRKAGEGIVYDEGRGTGELKGRENRVQGAIRQSQKEKKRSMSSVQQKKKKERDTKKRTRETRNETSQEKQIADN